MIVDYVFTKEIIKNLSQHIVFIGLLAIIFFDFITGIAKGIYLKTLSSEYGIKGLIRMITVIMLVVLIGYFSMVVKQEYIFITFATFFIIEYIISVIENLTLMNIPLPYFIKDVILTYRTMNEKKLKEQMKGVRDNDRL